MSEDAARLPAAASVVVNGCWLAGHDADCRAIPFSGLLAHSLADPATSGATPTRASQPGMARPPAGATSWSHQPEPPAGATPRPGHGQPPWEPPPRATWPGHQPEPPPAGATRRSHPQTNQPEPPPEPPLEPHSRSFLKNVASSRCLSSRPPAVASMHSPGPLVSPPPDHPAAWLDRLGIRRRPPRRHQGGVELGGPPWWPDGRSRWRISSGPPHRDPPSGHLSSAETCKGAGARPTDRPMVRSLEFFDTLGSPSQQLRSLSACTQRPPTRTPSAVRTDVARAWRPPRGRRPPEQSWTQAWTHTGAGAQTHKRASSGATAGTPAGTPLVHHTSAGIPPAGGQPGAQAGAAGLRPGPGSWQRPRRHRGRGGSTGGFGRDTGRDTGGARAPGPPGPEEELAPRGRLPWRCRWRAGGPEARGRASAHRN